jgi:hypothetical protein
MEKNLLIPVFVIEDGWLRKVKKTNSRFGVGDALSQNELGIEKTGKLHTCFLFFSPSLSHTQTHKDIHLHVYRHT